MRNEHKLIVENWRRFVVEQTQQAEQPQQAEKQPKQVLDIRRPQEIKNYLLSTAKGKAGSSGPDEITKQNLQKNDKIISTGRSINQPLQAAQIIIQLVSLLSDADKAELGKDSETIFRNMTAEKPQQKTQKNAPEQKQPVKEQLVTENLTLSAIQKLGGGDFTKGMQRIGSGAFIGALAMGMTQIANGDISGASGTLLVAIVNNLQKIISSNNISDLNQIITNNMEATASNFTGKRNDENIYESAHLDDGTPVCAACLQELLESERTIIQEAKYQGRTVQLNKPMKGDVKKSKVFVKDPKTGNVKKVNFGDKNMKIKKNIPARRKSFRARHNCENPGPKTKARYWSCKAW